MKDDRNRIITVLIILTLSFLALTLYVSSAYAPSVSARAAALYEPTSQSFIYTKNENKHLPMASTTKIMTALIALEQLSPTDLIEVDERAVGTDGSSIYLEEGEILSAESLLYALMLGSANDAAEALAYAISGDIADFAELMNKRAIELGATDTCFKNPHGLDAGGHYTTAHDLALIGAEALKNDLFRQVVSTYKKEIESSLKKRVVVNHNKLLKLYDGCIGVKTGYTQLSGRSLVSAAERDGTTLICVTIDAPDDWRDHTELLNYGFEIIHTAGVLEEGEISYSLPVLNSDRENIRITNKEAFKYVYRGEAPIFTRQVNLPRYFAAPVEAGDAVGEVVLYADGAEIGRVPLIAEENAAEIKKKSFWEGLF